MQTATVMEGFYATLEMDRVLHLLAIECTSDATRTAVLELPLYTDFKTIDRLLTEAFEAKQGCEKNERLPVRVYEDLTEDLRYLVVDGYVLSVEQLQRINAQLQIIRSLVSYFTPTRKENYPKLAAHFEAVQWDDTPATLIGRVMLQDGSIRPDASPELQKIRQRKASKEREVDGVFRSVLSKYRNSGFLAESGETIRNGRRVLSVPTEHKRKIRGILHDESATGLTAYIEPEETIGINNEVFELGVEELREMFRILKTLSAELREHIPQFKRWQTCIAHLDLCLAKAQLSIKMKANRPLLLDKPTLHIKKGVHPLLFLKNKSSGKKTIPFDLYLQDGTRMLVISGPNAGGKSVTMKTIGLQQLMLQSGLLVPASELSEFGIFKSFFADIGDSQSLEDDLSTYSSRLEKMKIMLAEADLNSLLLIDELGSGTDPNMGGAIAESILQQLHVQLVTAIITTHYPNIKIFAYKTQGIINGAMFFDRETLKPTYELRVGRPGSSYALEIANKIGLAPSVLKAVEKKLGLTDKAVEDLLVDLQQEKKETEDQLHALKEKQLSLDKLMRSYQELQKELEKQRKQLKLEATKQAYQLADKENKALEGVIREIRESQNIEAAKMQAEDARKRRESFTQLSKAEDKDLAEMEQAQIAAKTGVETLQWQVGNTVRLRQANGLGVIDSLSKNEAVVIIGGLKINARLRDLLPVENATAAVRRTNSIDLIQRHDRFDPTLDIRGVLPSDALKLIEKFVDDALVNGMSPVRILHGKGSGAMRNTVKQALKQYKSQLQTHHPEEKEGGDGITVVTF